MDIAESLPVSNNTGGGVCCAQQHSISWECERGPLREPSWQMQYMGRAMVYPRQASCLSWQGLILFICGWNEPLPHLLDRLGRTIIHMIAWLLVIIRLKVFTLYKRSQESLAY